MKIGEVLRVFRIVSNKKIKDVEEIIQVSQSYISNVENNRTKPSLKMIEKLAICYEVTASQIFLIQEKSEANNWNYQKILYEALILWFKTNDPEWLETREK